MAFDDLSDAELADARDRVSAAALHAARVEATRRLITGLSSADLGSPEEVLQILLSRDQNDRRHELLRAFEKAWALLTLRIIATVTSPTEAVRDARERGATVPEIAAALGITTQGVYATYKDAVVRRPRHS